MTNVEAVQTAAQIPAAEAAAAATAPAPIQEYSIRYFLAWHQRVFHDAATWCSHNGFALLTSALEFLLTIGISIAVLLLLRRVVAPVVGKWHKNTSKELIAISAPVSRLVFWFGFSLCVDNIPFSPETHQLLDRIFYVCFSLAVLSIILHALQCTSTLMLERFKRKSPENFSMNKLLLDLSLSIIRLAIRIFVIIFILQDVFHLQVTHLIASAGILGLGIAFAAKDTIANIFGAFSILGCKMFKVGDWIKSGSQEGIVEQIGIRSIQIRAFNDGRLIDIPNHLIADSQIENFSNRLYWREYFCFGLVYQTTPEQMILAKKILNDIGSDLSDLMAKDKPVRFAFNLFDQSSLNLDGYVWFKASDMLTMREARGRFNEEVLKRFSAAGLEIAFPTTTVVLDPQPEK